VGGFSAQLVGDAGTAVLVLLAITLIAVYKPWGLIRYGQRKLRGDAEQAVDAPMPFALKLFLMLAGAVVLIFVIIHHARGGVGTHGH